MLLQWDHTKTFKLCKLKHYFLSPDCDELKPALAVEKMYDEEGESVNVTDTVQCSATNQSYTVVMEFFTLQLLTSVVFQELTPDTIITVYTSTDGFNFVEYFNQFYKSTVSDCHVWKTLLSDEACFLIVVFCFFFGHTKYLYILKILYLKNHRVIKFRSDFFNFSSSCFIISLGFIEINRLLLLVCNLIWKTSFMQIIPEVIYEICLQNHLWGLVIFVTVQLLFSASPWFSVANRWKNWVLDTTASKSFAAQFAQFS